MSEVSKIDSQRLQTLAVRASRTYVDKGLHGLRAEVVMALDVSRHMAPLYADGTMQSLTAGLIALATRFDDDGVIPAWAFGTQARSLGELRHDDFTGWIGREVIRDRGDYQNACCYAPIINTIGSRYFPQEWKIPPKERLVGGKLKRTQRVYPSLIEKRQNPVFVIVVTAGDCRDPSEAAHAIRRSSHLPIFFQFAGLTPSGGPPADFEFLRKLDRLSDTYVDNCGFFQPQDLDNHEALIDGLLNEFPVYLEFETVSKMLLAPAEEEDDTYDDPDIERIEQTTVGPGPLEIARQESLRSARQRRRRLRRIQERQDAGKSLSTDDLALLASVIDNPTGDDDTVAASRPKVQTHSDQDAKARIERLRARRAARRALKDE